jgi:hypothetical protein
MDGAMENESLVLITECTPELLSDTTRALGKAGYQTIEAAIGQEGLRLMAQ